MRGFDLFNIKRKVSSKYDLDTVDLDSLIDSTLTGSENRQNIERQLGMNMSASTRYAMFDAPREGRVPKSERKGEFYQIGRSNSELDEDRRAKPPGQRYTGWGTTYVERRKNRSDKPGRRI